MGCSPVAEVYFLGHFFVLEARSDKSETTTAT